MTTPFVIFPMLWSWFSTLCHASSDTTCYKDKNFGFNNSFPTFWGQKMKFTIHCYYSSVTIHWYYSLVLFTPNFCLFKGGCPLCSKQVFCMLSSGLLPKREFSLEILSLWEYPCLLQLPTYSTKLVTPNPCNYFQLVITTTVRVQFYFQ